MQHSHAAVRMRQLAEQIGLLYSGQGVLLLRDNEAAVWGLLPGSYEEWFRMALQVAVPFIHIGVRKKSLPCTLALAMTHLLKLNLSATEQILNTLSCP